MCVEPQPSRVDYDMINGKWVLILVRSQLSNARLSLDAVYPRGKAWCGVTHGNLVWFCTICMIPKEVYGARQTRQGKREERNVGASL
jgi:hypothetical protein